MDEIVRAARELAASEFQLPNFEESSSSPSSRSTRSRSLRPSTPRTRSLSRNYRGRASQRAARTGSFSSPSVQTRSRSQIQPTTPGPSHPSVSSTVIDPTVLASEFTPLSAMANAEETPKGLTITSRFVGVAHGEEGRRLMQYNVDQFVEDMESLQACRQVTDDRTKIHLARLHIHQSIGDAFKFVNCSDYRAITTWDEFKRRLKRTYQTAYVSEPLLALAEYVTMPVAPSLLDIALEFARRRDTSIASMKNANLIEIGDRAYFANKPDTDQLVRLRDILHLMGQAVIYGHFSPNNRKIFRESKVKATENISTLTEAIREKAGKDIIAEEQTQDVFAVYRQGTGRQQYRTTPYPSSSHQKESGNKKGKNWNKKQEKCQRCKKKGHSQETCRVKLALCEYCGRDNHKTSDCRDKQQAERRFKDKGMSLTLGFPSSQVSNSPASGGAGQGAVGGHPGSTPRTNPPQNNK